MEYNVSTNISNNSLCQCPNKTVLFKFLSESSYSPSPRYVFNEHKLFIHVSQGLALSTASIVLDTNFQKIALQVLSEIDSCLALHTFKGGNLITCMASCHQTTCQAKNFNFNPFIKYYTAYINDNLKNRYLQMIQKGRKFEQWDYQLSLSLKSCHEHFSNKINFMCGNTNIKENKSRIF